MIIVEKLLSPCTSTDKNDLNVGNLVCGAIEMIEKELEEIQN